MIKKQTNMSNEEFDLNEIFATLLREKKLIFLITLISNIFTTIYLFNVKPIWKGSFNVVVRNSNNEKSETLSALSLITGKSANNDNETQRLILKSPSVLMPVFEFVNDYYLPITGEKQELDFKSWVSKSLDINFEDNSNVLTITYENQDKALILDTLNLISSRYKDYSRRDRIKSLTERRLYLESQKKIMNEKSFLSKKEYNNFTIKNRLGNVDGFIQLGKPTKSSLTFSNQSLGVSREINNNMINNFQDQNNDSAGQRFSNQFALLEKYEADYVDLSAKLKPSSKTLINLKRKIDNLQSALKRPNEILIKYDELYRNYTRDAEILNFIDQNLEIVKLEQIKVPNPWENISTPTIDINPVFPNKGRFLLFSIMLSLFISSLVALLKEKSSRKIFSIEELKINIESDYIDSLFRNEKQLNLDLLINQFKHFNVENKLKGIINFKGKSDLKFLNKLLDKKYNIKIDDFSNSDFITKSQGLLLIIEKGKYTYQEIDILNKYISLSKEKIIGWFVI